MKLWIDRECMLASFGMVAGIVPTRSPKPVLQNLKLTATVDQGSTLMATDLEVGIRYKVLGVKVDRPGSVLLPAGRVQQILRSCTGDDELAIEVEEGDGNSILHIRGMRSAFKLPSESPDLFPDPPGASSSAGPGWSIDPGELRRAIRRTSPCVDESSTRYALSGVLFEFDPDDPSTLRLVATDGRRLACQEVAVDGEAGVQSPGNAPVVPAKALKLIEKVLGDSLDETAHLHIDATGGGSILLRCGRATVWSRLVEGRFPSWKAVLPSSCDHRVEFAETGPLASAVDQARITTSKESRAIDCEFADGVLRLASATADVGNSSIEVPVESNGAAGLALSLDGVYFAEALRAIGDGSAFGVELIDHKSAVSFKTADGYSMIIMPLNRDRD